MGHEDYHRRAQSPALPEPVKQPAELPIGIRNFAIVAIRRRTAKIELGVRKIRPVRIGRIEVRAEGSIGRRAAEHVDCRIDRGIEPLAPWMVDDLHAFYMSLLRGNATREKH